MEASDFFAIPSHMAVPEALIPFAAMILAPLSLPEFEAEGPTWEDLLAVSAGFLARDAGLPESAPEVALGARTFGALCEKSGLIEVEDCVPGVPCSGAHPVRLTFKGSMFLAHARPGPA